MTCNQCKDHATQDLMRLGLNKREADIIVDSKITDMQIDFKTGDI